MVDPRNDVVETLTRLFWATDHHDWSGLRRVLDESVTLDYTATMGGEPVVLTPEQVIAGWRPIFEALDAHQHLVGNHLVEVDSDSARATASFVATHQFGGDTWTLGGDYRFSLRKASGTWRVAGMRMLPAWQTGPGDLVQRALRATKE